MSKNKLLLASLLLASPAAFADAYIGAGVQAGASRVEQDSQRRPVVDGRTIDQSDSESSSTLRVLAGFQLNERWALEATFQQPSFETGIEERVAGTGDDEEWESEVRALHFTLAPVYVHPLGNRLDLRVTAGLVYGDYELKRTHTLDVDNGPDQLLLQAEDSEKQFGGMAGIGLAYQTPWKVEVLAEALYQRTSLLSSTSGALSVVYRF